MRTMTVRERRLDTIATIIRQGRNHHSDCHHKTENEYNGVGKDCQPPEVN